MAAALATTLACATTTHTTDETVVRNRTRVVSAGATVANLDLQTHVHRDTRIIAAPAVRVFDNLPAAYAALGVKTVAIVDTMGGVYTIGVRNLLVHHSIGGHQLSEYVDCGTGPMNIATANTSDLYLSATTYVTASGANGSELHTLVSAVAQDPMSNAPPVRCESTQRFEERLARELRRATGSQ